MTGMYEAFLAALQFLTRIRLGEREYSPAAWRRGVAFFPFIGLVLGIIIAGAWEVSGYLVPAAARAGFTLALAVFLSGGLHLDGFIDSMDGFFSGRGRERMLAIMKDSHVGAHGVTAVVTLLVVKYSLITSVPPGKLWLAGLSLPPALVLAPLLSRWAMVPALTLFPYVRREGLGTLFGAGGGRPALGVATAIAILLSWLAAGPAGVVLLFLTGLLTLGWCLRVSRLLGGLTGDTYGALAEITEVFVLAACLFWPW